MALPGSLNSESKPISASVVSLARGIEAPDTVRLSNALQTTLDVEQMLRIFSDTVQEQIAHHGVTYRNEDRRFVLNLGQNARHRCSYRVTLLGTDLGEVALSRNKRFSEQELAQLEYMLCALVYPLRNALLYRDALAAAHRDPLTGIGNRAALEQSLAREISIAQRQGIPLSMLAIDIDFFKRINDRHGHAVGDCVLRTVTQRIVEVLRTSDLVFRFGGEEFVVLLADTDVNAAALVAERIRAAIADLPCPCEERSIGVTISLGVAELNDKGADALFDRADHALYQAKENGRNCVVVTALQ